MHDYDPHAPEIKYVQDDKNTCVFISLDYSFFTVNEHVVEHSVVSRLSSSLSCETVGFINRIKFASNILTDRVINKEEQQCSYNLVQWKNKLSFDIFNDISDHVTLFQL